MSKKPSYPDELESIIKAMIQQSVGYFISELSEERANVLRYYAAELPLGKKGRSGYVHPVVYTTVSSGHATLSETFSAGSKILSFKAKQFGDDLAAKQATSYTRHVLYDQNDGERIIDQVILDGFLARNGVAKAWWETSEELAEETFEGLAATDFDALLARDDTQDFAYSDDEDADGNPMGTVSGKMNVSKDTSQVRIDVVAPEDFYVEPLARSLKNSFHAQRVLMTKAEIKALGYDVSLLDDTKPDGDTNYGEASNETLARNSRLDTGLGINQNTTREQDMKYQFFECYLPWTSDDDRPAMFKVISVAQVILDFEEVKESPFISFAPIPGSHRYYGDNFAAQQIPAQASMTAMIRAGLDHTAITTNPKWVLQTGSAMTTTVNELLRSPQGGIVQVKDVAGLVPLQYPQLNPMIPTFLGIIKASSEEISSISALSTGLDKDVISNQNSQGMINDQVALSQVRLDKMARHFANDFLAPLFVRIYNLVLENDINIEEHEIQINGAYTKIDPKSWIARKTADVDLSLDPNDSAQEAQRFLTTMAMISQDPQVQHMMTPQNKFNSLSKVFDMMGWTDFNSLFTPPSKLPAPQPPPPDPIQMGQLQLDQQKAKLDVQKVQNDHEYRMAEMQYKMLQLKLQAENYDVSNHAKMADMHRKDLEAASNIDAQQREIKILEMNPPQQTAAQDAPKPNPL